MKTKLLLTLCLAVALSACKAKELAGKADIAQDLEKRGTTELMEQVANDEYTAPADGRITEAQVEMYLKVREHEKKIAQVAKEQMKEHAQKAEAKGDKSLSGMMAGLQALGSAADLVTADIRAAKDLGFNTQEYLWVKQQILAVSTAEMARKFSETMDANFQKAYDEAKKAHDEATDDQTKKLYADMLAGYEKSRQEMQQSQDEDPAVAHNRKVVAKYESALNAFAHELSKYEDKEGEVQKSMDELEKQHEAAKSGSGQ
jgi:hypothetical protein